MTPESKRRIAAQIVATCLFLLIALLLSAPPAPTDSPAPITTPFDTPKRVDAIHPVMPAPSEQREPIVIHPDMSQLDIDDAIDAKSRIASSFLRDGSQGHDPLVIQEAVPEDLREQLGQPTPKDGMDRRLMLQLKQEILERPDLIRCNMFIQDTGSRIQHALMTVNAGESKMVSNQLSDNRVHSRYLNETREAGSSDRVTAEYFFLDGNNESVRLEVLIQYYRADAIGRPQFDPVYFEPFYLNIPVR